MRLHAAPSRLGARPRGPEPVSWSRDERVSVSTERGVRVAEILLLGAGGGGGEEGGEEAPGAGDPRPRLRVTALQIPSATSAVSVGPQQQQEEEEAAAAHAHLEEAGEEGTLGAADRHEFALHRGFTRTHGANVPLRGGCVCARWSPVGCDVRGRSMLVCLSSEGFVSLWVWAERDVHTWSCLADLTQMYRDILKKENYHAADGASLKDFDEFKRRSQMQAPVSVEWSRMFTTTRVRDKSGACEEIHFALLAVMMASGHIVVWQVLVPASTSAHVVLGSVLESGLASPRSLSWWACHVGSQNINGLVVGDSMGQVRLLPVNLSAVKGYFTLRQPVTLWSSQDGLSVNFIRTLDMVPSGDTSVHGAKLPSSQGSGAPAAQHAGGTGVTEQAGAPGGPPQADPARPATAPKAVAKTASKAAPKAGSHARASPHTGALPSSTSQCGRTSVVLAARGPHLLACVVCVSGGGMSVQTAHVTGLHPQPICGMAAVCSNRWGDGDGGGGDGGMVYTASADGSLCCVWPVLCSSGGEGDVSVSIPAVAGQRRWVRFERRIMRLPGPLGRARIRGLAASPNGAFLAVLTTEGLSGGDSEEEEVASGQECKAGRDESAEKQRTRGDGEDLGFGDACERDPATKPACHRKTPNRDGGHADGDFPVTLGLHPPQRTYSLAFVSLVNPDEAFRRLVSVPPPDSPSLSACGLAFLRADLLEVLRSHSLDVGGRVPAPMLAELDRLTEAKESGVRSRDRGRWAAYLTRVRLYLLRFAIHARGRPRSRWPPVGAEAFARPRPATGTGPDGAGNGVVSGVKDESVDGIKDEEDDDDDDDGGSNAGGEFNTADATRMKSTEAVSEGAEHETEDDWLLAEIRRRERVLARGAACRVLERAFLCTRFDLHLHLPARGLLSFITSGDTSAHATDAQVLAANILKKIGKQDIQEKCVLCAAVIPFVSHAKATCANGHQWLRCAVTFAACQTWRYRRCILHDSVAAFPKATDPEWMKQHLDSPCIYCDSPYL
uniref:General transcription factor 3C polypeptide 4 n=1 Tax=Petromyzon marinus TaxID=7757 RepID=A0AAJ7T9M6_PETMA|nr:general transcription factor 3C polypeptide 4 [Petromyzon marinus]